MTSEVISARFDAALLKKMDELIESGDFGSRGEFVQFAVRKMLKEYKGRMP